MTSFRGLTLFLSALFVLPGPAWGYDINTRWTTTQTDGSGNQRGDALTLLWSIVPDGESWSRGGPSDLIDTLDDGWNVAAVDRTADLTNRPWWSIMDRVYDQYTRVSGLTMIYEPEQTPRGQDTGNFGDIRIGGVPFTWENDTGGVLADNSFPNNGDMRIDTYRSPSTGNPSFFISNGAQLRNLIAHESGHGVGLSHSDITGANAVMETPLESNFWGLQFDDIYAFNRLYGDPHEKGAGNDSPQTGVTELGSLGISGSAVLGTDANDSVVSEFDDDWLGIDGTSDEDWFRFSTTGRAWTSVRVLPRGPTYSTEEQGANTDFSARSDLQFEIYAPDGSTRLLNFDVGGVGETELVDHFVLPEAGDYYVRVTGDDDLNQFYQLDVDVSTGGQFGDPLDDNVIFVDSFDTTSDDNDNVNHQRFFFARQKHGVVDSYYRVSTRDDSNGATPSVVDLKNDQLHFMTTSDGTGSGEQAIADLLRNFGPQLVGQTWSLSFDVSVNGDAGLNDTSWLSLVFSDSNANVWPWQNSAELVLTLQADGDIDAKSGSQDIGSTNQDTSSLNIELVVDESNPVTVMDVLLNGVALIEDQALSLNSIGRYFNFRMFNSANNPAGLSLEAYVDNLQISLLSALAADLNGDGLVSQGDLDLVLLNWGRDVDVTGIPDGWVNGLPNGVISQDELDLVLLNWGAGSAPSIAIPEPGSAMLLASLLWGLQRRDRTATR